MNRSAADTLSEALVIWVGQIPSSGYDREAALVARFGMQKAAELVPLLRVLKEDFFTSNARHVADNVQAMHKLASADFQRKHPEISDQAVHVLANDYAFTFK